MSRVLGFSNSNVLQKDILNPTSIQVAQAINRLDGIRYLGIGLEISSTHLLIGCSSEGRMSLIYLIQDDEKAIYEVYRLLNMTESAQEEHEFLLDNGEIDFVPGNETVSREVVLELAQRFFEDGSLPELPEGLVWKM